MRYITVALLALAVAAHSKPTGSRWNSTSELADGPNGQAVGSGGFPMPTAAPSNGSLADFALPKGLFVRATKKTSSKKPAAKSTPKTPTATTKVPAAGGSSPAGTSTPPAAQTTPAAKSTGKGSTGNVAPAAGGKVPKANGTSKLAAVQTIGPGKSFDGGMVMYDRGTSCLGQKEGNTADAVFVIQNGGSLSNVIIGPNQREGVHCYGRCKLTNVWWSAVCEDAFSIKQQADGDVSEIVGGGAFGAKDKVLQHNSGGTLKVSGFTVDGFGKLYRACGNCKQSNKRHIIMDHINAKNGGILAAINANFGDTATLNNIVASNVKDICVEFQGVSKGTEPAKSGKSGPSNACHYSPSDIKSS